MQHSPLGPSPCLSITLFGGLSVQYGNQRVDDLPPQQTASLLAYLALSPGYATSRQELLALLWPDSEQEKASQNLRQCLRTLRLLLEQPPFTAGNALLANRTAIRLNPDIIQTDVNAFECAIEAAKQTTERTSRIAHLACAAEIYRGELLPGFYLDLFVAARHRLAEVSLQAVNLLVRDLEEAGDLERALHFARRAARFDPLSESACGTLMRVYAALGEPAAVLRQYREWEAQHIREFGQQPDPASWQIAQQWQEVAVQQAALRHEPVHPSILVSRPNTEDEDTATSSLQITTPRSSPTPTADEATLAPQTALVGAHRHRRVAAFIAGTGLLLTLLAWFVRVGPRSGPRSHDTDLTRGVHSPEALPARSTAAPVAASRPATPKPTAQQAVTPQPRNRATAGQIASTSSLKPGPRPTNALKQPGRSGDIRDFPVSRSRPFGPPAASGSTAPPLALPHGAGSPPEAGSGEELWSRYYPLKPGDKDDQPTAMTTDLAGNIYLTGFVNTSKTDVDYQTLKYRPDGRLLWEQRYNGPGNDLDRAQAIAVDDTGNVYITGESDGGKGEGPERLNSLDIATIKYSPDGKQLWVRRYDGPGHGMDSGRQIRLDGAGNLYVFGQSWGGDSSAEGGVDLILLKYAADGALLWEQRYPTRTRVPWAARAMILGDMGSIYITGAVRALGDASASNGAFDIITVKYDENGRMQWDRRNTSSGTGSIPTCMTVDRGGHVFVVGFYRTGILDGVARDEYLILKYDRDGNCEWKRSYPWSGMVNRPTAATTDSAGNLYITGQAQIKHDGTDAFATLAYGSDGTLLWADTYRGTGGYACIAVALAINSVGEIYVIGMARYVDLLKPNQATADRQACVTLAYSSDGQRGRLHRYFERSHLVQGPICMGVDEHDNVLVAGQMAPNGIGNTLILKYAP